MSKVPISVSQIYSVRYGVKLPLPAKMKITVDSLRKVPCVYKPYKYVRRNLNRAEPESRPSNWRDNILVDFTRKIKEREDPEYSEIFSIFNKIAHSNVAKLSEQTISLMQKRDETFRLRVSILLFDKAIHTTGYASILADCAQIISDVIPEIIDDLKSQIGMFGSLYNMTETSIFPEASDPDFDNKIITWKKQKDIRRGYAKFMTQLYLRKLIDEFLLVETIASVLTDLTATARQPKTPQTEENTTQFVDFIGEVVAELKTHEISTSIKAELTKILAIPRTEVPSLCMRSRFKIEDLQK